MEGWDIRDPRAPRKVSEYIGAPGTIPHNVMVDGRRLLGRTDAKRMNAVMLTCGTYDAAGEFAYRVGLPAKSGVGGGVLAVIPQHGTLCAWGPRLDAAGNSVSAIAALDQFTTATGLSVF